MDTSPSAASSLAHIKGPDFEIPEGTLADHFRRVVALRPDRAAVVFLGLVLDGTLTYRQLDELSDAVAAGLQSRGMRPGDRVAMFMPATTYYPVMMIAARKAGLTLVNIMPATKQDREQKPGQVASRVNDAIRTTRPDYLLTLDVYNFVDICNQARRGTGLKGLVVCSVPDILHPFEARLYPLHEALEPVKTAIRDRIGDWRAGLRTWRENNLTRENLRAQWEKAKSWPSDAAHAAADAGRFAKAAVFHARLRPSYFGHVVPWKPSWSLRPRGAPARDDAIDDRLLALARAAGGGDPSAITRGGSRRGILDFKDLVREGERPKPHAADPSDLALLQPTSGTGGHTQWVRITDRNMLANVRQCERQFNWLDLDPAKPAHETMLTFLPPAHIFSHEVGIWFPLLTGSTLVLSANPYDQGNILKTVTRHRPTMMLMIPPWMGRAADNPNMRWTDWSSVKAVIPGGSALSASVLNAWQEKARMPGRVLQGYGCSEASPVVASNIHPDDNDPDTVGRVFAGTEVKIVGEDGRVLNKGQRGVIHVRGPQVATLGYHNDPDATARTFLPGGWLNTGDIGVIDGEDRLRIVGRVKRIAIVNGSNVSVEDVERALGGHSGISQCVAFAVEDPSAGETILAVVKLKEGAEATPETIRDFLQRAGLDSKTMPGHIEITAEDLPLLASGKPDWKRMQDARYHAFMPAAPAAALPFKPTFSI